MYSYKVFIFLVTIISLISFSKTLADHENINKSIDELFNELRSYLKKEGLEKVILPDFGFSGTPIFLSVSLSDLSTIYRTGDCEIWTENDLLRIKMNIGLKQMQVDADQCPITKGPTSLMITGASAEIDITLHADGESCHASWDYINISSLGRMVVQSADQTYNGQIVRGDLINNAINYYNKLLNRNDILINIHLISDIVELCQFPSMIEIYNKFKPNL
ncbi:hypothetical protein O3M35_011776 [Rhynocoris fuscipes]|uniref:Secreted protein n=1 Tax=Rhynocoris fuscipes TaxID=488301 RepID=A0AAW1D203_9HEMI